MSTTDTDLVWIQLHVEMSRIHQAEVTDYVSVPRAEWEAMTEAEQEQWIEQAVEDHLSNSISYGGWVVDAADIPRGYGR